MSRGLLTALEDEEDTIRIFAHLNGTTPNTSRRRAPHTTRVRPVRQTGIGPLLWNERPPQSQHLL
jgi:hypothetical protein